MYFCVTRGGWVVKNGEKVRNVICEQPLTENNFKELKLETTIKNHVKNKKQKTILQILLRNKNHSIF